MAGHFPEIPVQLIVPAPFRPVKYLFPLLFVLVAAPCQARLGETRAQTDARYGKGRDLEKGITDRFLIGKYFDGNYRITITFLDGKSASEVYARKDGNDLTGDEIQKILDANSLGSEWSRVMYPDTDKNPAEQIQGIRWLLMNGMASARYIYWDLSIETTEYTKEYLKAIKQPRPGK